MVLPRSAHLSSQLDLEYTIVRVGVCMVICADKSLMDSPLSKSFLALQGDMKQREHLSNVSLGRSRHYLMYHHSNKQLSLWLSLPFFFSFSFCSLALNAKRNPWVGLMLHRNIDELVVTQSF